MRASLVAPEELGEDLGQVPARDSRRPDRSPSPIPRAPSHGTDDGQAARGRVLAGVLDQVAEDPLDLVGIGVAPSGKAAGKSRRASRSGYSRPILVVTSPASSARSMGWSRSMSRPDSSRLMSSSSLISRATRSASWLTWLEHGLLLVVAELRPRAQEQPGEALDGGERRAQLVADRGHDLQAPLPIGPAHGRSQDQGGADQGPVAVALVGSRRPSTDRVAARAGPDHPDLLGKGTDRPQAGRPVPLGRSRCRRRAEAAGHDLRPPAADEGRRARTR